MEETEVKILDIDPEKVRKKLIDAGAKKIFKGSLIAKIFDFPDARLKKNGGYIRLRKAGDKVEMTFKEKIKSDRFKKRNEIETHIADHDAVKEMLLKLGMKEVKSYKKTRESYRLGNIQFDMDFYSEPVKFRPMIEVESTEEGVQEGVRLLGYEMKDTVSKSIWSLLKNKN